MAGFKDKIAKFNKKAEKAANMIFRGTALSLAGSIIRRTPVDTGRLRGNWQTTINAAADGVVERTSQNGATSEAKETTSRASIGQSIFITNNLPYAKVIENGSSKQAPQGMVKVAVAEFLSHVKLATRRHKV